ncbi:MAG: zinc-ribbon and DUF3426 domain-containing protein [Rhodanobacteraceae bacterium]
MYTQCPECLTIFEIDEDALQASLGIVHCGHCSTRFDALRSLSNTLPLDPEAPLAESDVEPRVLTLTTAVSPAELELAARKSQRTEHPEPASGSFPMPPATAVEAATGDPSAADTNADWLVNLRTDLTDALIADAAGIAPGDTQPDNTWQVLDAPVQARFSELDIIPVTAPEPTAIESTRDESADAQAEPAPWDADTATDQVPTIDPDQMEIPSMEADDFDTARDDITPAEIDDFDLARIDAIDPVEVATDVDEADAVDATTETPSETAEAQAPIYIRPRQRRFNRASALWTLGCLVLIVCLAVQLAWAKRVELLQNPQARTWAIRACDTIDCRLPPIRDVAKLELLSRDIRPDPRTTGALVITATLRNNANFRQPWPVVTVELSDLDGKPVAMRRFRPAEYMPDAARRAAGMAEGATAAVAFEVADPGKNAVNFQFSFE